ncbi:MAG: class I SAM-dependent methyltransferase [Pseudomonadales bacterium]
MAERDREKWQARYLQRATEPESALQIPRAPHWVEHFSERLADGALLDVASGDGACALHLARDPRFHVTALDIAQAGLDRLAGFAASQGVNVSCIQGDLDDAKCLAQLGEFRSVVINYYKPSAAQWEGIIALLQPGGTLLMNTFNARQHSDCGFNLRFCLTPGELLTLGETLQLEDYRSSESAPYCDTYLFTKLGPA